MRITNTLCLIIWSLLSSIAQAQIQPNLVLAPNIHSVRFHVYGDQLGMPIYRLNSNERMELHFDDMDTRVKAYFYTYQLCDYNWRPINMSPFDYIKGFTQQRITTYRFSSQSFSRYTHYQAILPEANSVPSRSGNYILKVFLDGDTSKLVLTRALLVLDSKATVGGQMMQPFQPQFFRSHQRIRFDVRMSSGINSFNANQQVKVRVLQNQRWDKSQGEQIYPTFVRGNVLEYNMENQFLFPAGKEWRWADLRSFRLLGDRVDSGYIRPDSAAMFMRVDQDLTSQRYMFFADMNGLYQQTTYESINPYWQADYAKVHFRFLPPGGRPYPDRQQLFLVGQLTDYQKGGKARMEYNPSTGLYETQLWLKQGFYNYGYELIDTEAEQPTQNLDGDYWETENIYTILVYYKGFADQHDQLIGVGTIRTRLDRPGLSF